MSKKNDAEEFKESLRCDRSQSQFIAQTTNGESVPNISYISYLSHHSPRLHLALPAQGVRHSRRLKAKSLNERLFMIVWGPQQYHADIEKLDEWII